MQSLIFLHILNINDLKYTRYFPTILKYRYLEVFNRLNKSVSWKINKARVVEKSFFLFEKAVKYKVSAKIINLAFMESNLRKSMISYLKHNKSVGRVSSLSTLCCQKSRLPASIINCIITSIIFLLTWVRDIWPNL